MLKNLSIHNYKCLENINISLGPFNVFIGPNDTGKTSLLEALCFLSKTIKPSTTLKENFIPPYTFKKVRCSKANTSNISFGFTSDEVHEYHLSLVEKLNDVVVKEERLKHNGKELITQNSENKEVYGHNNIMYGNNATSLCHSIHYTEHSQVKEIADLLKGIKLYSLKPSRLAKDSYLEPSDEALQNPHMSQEGYGLPSILSLLSSTAPEDERYAQVKQYLRAVIPSIASFGIAAVPVQYRKKSGENVVDSMVTGQSLYFELTNDKSHRVPAPLMSDGTLLLLGYLTLVHTADDLSILLIEEPENGIHPKLLQFVVKILRDISEGRIHGRPVQVIVTTHSPYFLDFTTPEEVFVFQKDDKGLTNITPMKEIKGIHDWSKEYLLGELWYNWGEEEMLRRAKQ